MPKILLFTIVLVVIIFTSIGTLLFARNDPKSVSKIEIDSAINQAKLLYRQKKERGENLSNGPCLSTALMPNWVADIVHDPRLAIDDLPENQCSSYIEGRSQHFVELDTDGNLIRAR